MSSLQGTAIELYGEVYEFLAEDSTLKEKGFGP